MNVGGFIRAMAVILALPAMVCVSAEHAPLKESGRKKLLLFAKNPATWAILRGGASGRMIFRRDTGAFTLSANGLHPHASYALVRYADAPPRAEILARGISDKGGRLGLAGTWRNWTRKFWLVSGEDVVGSIGEAGRLRAWRPDRYLFEEKQLGVPCECPEPDEPE